MVSTLGFPPDDIIRQSPLQHRGQFFEPSDGDTWSLQQPENANDQKAVDNATDASAGMCDNGSKIFCY